MWHTIYSKTRRVCLCVRTVGEALERLGGFAIVPGGSIKGLKRCPKTWPFHPKVFNRTKP